MKVVNWKICPHCGAKKKNLPLHIKGVHEVTSTETPEFKDTPWGPAEVVMEENIDTGKVDIKMTKERWDTLTGFNFGEINMCQICREEYPSKIMEFHMHTRHGM